MTNIICEIVPTATFLFFIKLSFIFFKAMLRQFLVSINNKKIRQIHRLINMCEIFFINEIISNTWIHTFEHNECMNYNIV